jgi:predicted DsbA family dithiol-disulfide isomerase
VVAEVTPPLDVGRADSSCPNCLILRRACAAKDAEIAALREQRLKWHADNTDFYDKWQAAEREREAWQQKYREVSAQFGALTRALELGIMGEPKEDRHG